MNATRFRAPLSAEAANRLAATAEEYLALRLGTGPAARSPQRSADKVMAPASAKGKDRSAVLASRRRGAAWANHRCAPAGDVLRSQHAILGPVESCADETIYFLDACRLSRVESAVLRIDSCGGFFDPARRICNAIRAARNAGTHITSIIEGRCFSAATLIAAASDCVVARPSATWMIHEASLKGAVATKVLREINAMAARSYSAMTGRSEGSIAGQMIVGKPMSAVVARSHGFVRHVLDEDVFPWDDER